MKAIGGRLLLWALAVLLAVWLLCVVVVGWATG